MNKSRMTFRFDERQRQQLEKREVEVDGEDLDSTWIQSPFEERQDVPRLERTQRTKIKNDIYPRKSDKLNVITSQYKDGKILFLVTNNGTAS
ncbi:hypothetical protein JCM16418_4201 [Paenibacillus pini JCM 16418]|uniref:Uncharacterized protein n=2 Tax=Paenibacillus TaxID=44249 RepID=W7YZD9_9BACL|nr:hypothetical protein JCM16418_4201 [Paenibacillus pini JCM 16418]